MKRAVLSLYRVRGPLFYAAAAILVGNIFVDVFISYEGGTRIRGFIVLTALMLAVLCVLVTFLGPRLLPHQQAHTVLAPVRGRWLGMNSPASKVPSHGVRAYGQTYAIDIVHEPGDTVRPTFGGPAMRASPEYPAFGEPVLAMIDGTVVRTSGWRRDHRARSNWLGLLYLMAEGAIREMGGPGFIVGNQVTIRGDDGTFSLVAHLQQGSPAVAVGDHVQAGQTIGACGNSGNSSEPHVHAQLMDRISLWTAQGIPMVFAGIALDDADSEVVDALPANEQHMTTGFTHSEIDGSDPH